MLTGSYRDAFTQREKANEDAYIREREKEKLQALKEKKDKEAQAR